MCISLSYANKMRKRVSFQRWMWNVNCQQSMIPATIRFRPTFVSWFWTETLSQITKPKTKSLDMQIHQQLKWKLFTCMWTTFNMCTAYNLSGDSMINFADQSINFIVLTPRQRRKMIVLFPFLVPSGSVLYVSIRIHS